MKQHALKTHTSGRFLIDPGVPFLFLRAKALALNFSIAAATEALSIVAGYFLAPKQKFHSKIPQPTRVAYSILTSSVTVLSPLAPLIVAE